MRLRFHLFLFFILISAPPASAQELLSAQPENNRLGTMMSDCQNILGLPIAQCECGFAKAIDTNISNAVLMDYYGGYHRKLENNTIDKMKGILQSCGHDLPDKNCLSVYSDFSDN